MLAEPADAPAREEHRSGAVAAYRAYLQDTPNAEDRDEVERIILELGGTPPKRPGMRLPLVHPDDPPAKPPQLHEVGIPRVDPDPSPGTADPEPTPQPRPQPQPMDRERELRARVGPFVPLVLPYMRRLAKTDDVMGLPLLGLGGRGAAFVGKRKRVPETCERFVDPALGKLHQTQGVPHAMGARIVFQRSAKGLFGRRQCAGVASRL